MKRVHVLPNVEPMSPGSPVLHHRRYQVHLGNHRFVSFTTRRDALAYHADTTRWLNTLLLEANTLLAEAMMDHRLLWPLLDGGETELKLRELLDQCVWQLDKAAAKGRRVDALFHGWRHIRGSLERIAAAYGVMERFYRGKTQGVLRWRMAMRRHQCEAAMERMDNYGTAPAYGEPGFRPPTAP